MKNWLLDYEVNMDASHHEKVTIKSNTERKAKILSEDKLHKAGYFHTRLISCEEIKKKKNNGKDCERIRN